MNREPLNDVPASAVQWMEVLQQASAAVRRVRRSLGQLTADQQMTDSELFILWACAAGPVHGAAQVEIAAQTGASTAQTSGLVEKLRERGWLVDRRSAGDRRLRLWTISSSGRAALEQVLSSLCRQMTAQEQDRVFPVGSADQLLALISQWSSAATESLGPGTGPSTDRREAA